MKKFFTWFALMGKRQLKNPLLLILLLLIPVISVIAANTQSEDTHDTYRAGIYLQGSDDFSTALADSLTDYTGSYSFSVYEDFDNMLRDIKNNTILSGYVFPDNLPELIRKDDWEHSVSEYHIPGNTVQTSMNEMVYSNLVRIQGYNIISDYIGSIDSIKDFDEEKQTELKNYYDGYLKGDVTFHILTNTLGTDAQLTDVSSKVTTKIKFPLRPILAVLVFLASLFGGIIWMRDRESGVFLTLTTDYNRIALFMYLFIPTVLFGIVALISLFILGIPVSTSKEILGMALLVALSLIFTALMIKITRTSKTFASLVPIIILCTMIFCPVFLNVENYIPAAKYIEKIFVPYYYLNIF